MKSIKFIIFTLIVTSFFIFIFYKNSNKDKTYETRNHAVDVLKNAKKEDSEFKEKKEKETTELNKNALDSKYNEEITDVKQASFELNYLMNKIKIEKAVERLNKNSVTEDERKELYWFSGNRNLGVIT